MPQSRFSSLVATTDISGSRFGLVGLVGFFIGALTWVIFEMLQKFFIGPVFCESVDPSVLCTNGESISLSIAILITSIIALVAFIKLAVYRPLLVVIASIATIWGVQTWLGNLSWWEASLWFGLLTGLAYALYSWIARMVSFVATLLVMIVIIILFRLFMAQI